MRSCSAFVMPITLTGLQALSVEIASATSTSAPGERIARTTLLAPRTFVFTASMGSYSHEGTCLRAAAWNTNWAARTAAEIES